MVDIAKLKAANLVRWQNCRINPGSLSEFQRTAARLVADKAKARYLVVEKATGVPWWAIAVIHEREASQRWDTQLGQGDPLDRPSVHEPAGRGPFKTWEDGAVDALLRCAPFLALKKDWTIGGALVNLELYNGAGYDARGLPSPYLWAGTDQYRAGKFVADGKFDQEVVDKQLGCAGMLVAMMAVDPSIFAVPMPIPPVRPMPKPVPAPPPAPPTSFWTLILSIIRAIFRRN